MSLYHCSLVLVAELSLENRLLKKNMIGHGGDEE